jgi:hypothetical protein
VRLAPGWIPRGEEQHAVLTLGHTPDWAAGEEEGDLEEIFHPAHLFVWRHQGSVCLRTRHLLFQTWLEPGVETLHLELCIEDGRELESVRLVGGQELECRLEVPAAAKAQLMEEARAGRVQALPYSQVYRYVASVT